MDSERIIEAVLDEAAPDESTQGNMTFPSYDEADRIPILTALTALAMSGVCPECGGQGVTGLIDNGPNAYICDHEYHDHREALEAMLDE